MTNAAEANPFRQAAQTTWLAAEQAHLVYEERERLQRQAHWYEQEAARRDVRRGLVMAPRTSPEVLPRRVPGCSWEAVTGIPLDFVPPPASWNPADPGPDTLKRTAMALRQMQP
jgi:hypothetical protein